MKAWRFLAFLSLLCLAGCIPFSSFQSARIVPRGAAQATISASHSDLETGDTESAGWTYLDVRGRFGVLSRVDCSVGLTMAWESGTSNPGAILGGDIRYGVWKDRVTLVLPMTVVVGDPEFSTLQSQPGIVVTVPISPRWDVTAAGRSHIMAKGPEATHWSFDLGLGVPVPGAAWTLRPEVGWMYEREDRYWYTHFGVGLETDLK